MTPTMNVLHYLYVKANSRHTRFENSPRLAVSWPLWTSVVIFTPLDMLGSTWSVFLAFAMAYLMIYILVLAVYPSRFVNWNYRKWEKKYRATSSLWFYVYFCSPFIFIVIRAYIMSY